MESKDPDPQTFAIVGAAMKAHRVLGCGFLEAVYRAALAVELARESVPFLREVAFSILYDGQPLGISYYADLVCYESVIVEVKALGAIGPVEEAQVINYLKASRLRRALVLNFGTRSLQVRRFVL
jgi:GxxExxY protein